MAQPLACVFAALTDAEYVPFHDAGLGASGDGKRGTTSAFPSITFALCALASNDALRSSTMASSSSSVRLLSGLLCSTLCSRGTSSAQIFMYAAGCVLRTFSIAAAPCFLKSAANARRKSLLNDLRVASNEPPGFPDHPGANLPLMRLGE